MIRIISSAERDTTGERAKEGGDSSYVRPSHQVVLPCHWRYFGCKVNGIHVYL
jgi:hypothetical protein